MAGSSFGKNFRVHSFGESHGPALGVVIDGVPAGLALEEAEVQAYLDRRKPGTSAFTTKRKESDTVEFLSGVFEGKTTGTPLAMLVRNTDQRSRDYSEIAKVYRPGHADYGFDEKYGFRDYRGGGRSSGRETVGRVAAGAVAAKILRELGIEVMAYTKAIGPVEADPERFDRTLILTDPTAMPDAVAAKEAAAYLEECMKAQDSVGGVVECKIRNVPAGLGEPVFDKLDAKLSQALFSIGAVKAVEVGDGCDVSKHRGSENNDAFLCEGDKVRKKTNHAGGILGGISDGDEIVLRAYFKPTPSISLPQDSVNREHEPVRLEIHGRHDPIIVPRAVVVVESMAAMVIADALMEQTHARMEYLAKIFG